ncbi:ATP-dependent helicase HrpB [Glutamicibacter sp. NPDC087344]|uniref:ATP-dependent helicase HrpB n=1 Tax=Glutamicibacter sp. NPDC087344 TaxID=3363994 RepID=UPI00382D8318
MSPANFDLEAISEGLAFGPSRHEIYSSVESDPAAPVVIQAPPGSGKTTIVPPTVANALCARNMGGRVIVTQPRRVAARAAARRLAQLDQSKLGDRVGYSVRGERMLSAQTKVEFVTAGLMLRRLLADPDLGGVSALIIDEVHERSIDTDLLLAMSNQVSQLRDDFTLIVMSATVHAQELSQLLSREGPAKVLRAQSAQFPVHEQFDSFTGQRQNERGLSPDYLRHVALTAIKHSALANEHTDHPIDTLVFLPGVGEVQRVCAQLEASGANSFALHSQISSGEQDAILSLPPVSEPARIIVATSIAESSLTVPRVHLVVDAGYAREPRRDEGRGFSGLVTVVASRAAATQRAGRAGRLGPGMVVRTLDPKSYAAAPAHSTPEIRTADLVGAGLSLAAWGAERGEGLQMWEHPPQAAMLADEQVLYALDAVDQSGRITSLGEQISTIPADPRTASALLKGTEHFGAPAAAEVVAMLTGAERASNADVEELLNSLRRTSHPGHRSWKQETKRLTAMALAGKLRAAPAVDSSGAVAGICALAYPQWVARRMAPGEFLLASGTRASLPRGSHLDHFEYLAVAEVSRAGAGAIIRRAAGIDFELARELLPQLYHSKDTAQLVEGKVSARRVESFGSIELSSRPIKVSQELGILAAHTALSEQGLAVFGVQEGFEVLRRRMAVAFRLLGEPFTAMDEDSLIHRADQWLTEPLRRLAAGQSTTKIDLESALRTLLPWEHAHDFNELVPPRLQVPSGSRITVHYPEVDETGPAVVSVKLQECFGLKDSPRLVNGKLPVQFHLLSPAGRPLAVTDDLDSFFNGPYQQVRSEMRGRYPRHPWPENPWEHVATASTKNRLKREAGGQG